MINQGDRVEWSSTSNGSTTAKEGVAEGVISKGTKPSELFPFLCGISNSRIKLGGGSNGSSSIDRVLVRVARVSKTGEALEPVYYAPRLSGVNVVVEAEH